MRYIITLIWTFLLTHMAGYIVASMNRAAYDFTLTSILAVVFTVILFIFAEVSPMKETESSTKHS
ncbi:YjzD family protein [Bacillus altitudinis]|uniref:YjzD family protein n=1 Tax=Bacillus pumilus TaxID=1408 RepID=UPI0025A0BC5F|nr:YjzD family protein [Bacillus pumilus]MDM5319463.1 YjzD family protein [Bacillus pumilus]MDR4993894.1 YjzD family protein [Bacillus altitudinis]